jgi:hypothetical protein
MTKREATCCCGDVRVTCEGEPVRISICHCFECQRRTGSVFGAQARFPREQVHIEGATTQYLKESESGNKSTTHFCPKCGSTVFWTLEMLPDFVYVAIGAFADPTFGAPTISVYDERKHPWVAIAPGFQMQFE